MCAPHPTRRIRSHPPLHIPFPSPLHAPRLEASPFRLPRPPLTTHILTLACPAFPFPWQWLSPGVVRPSHCRSAPSLLCSPSAPPSSLKPPLTLSCSQCPSLVPLLIPAHLPIPAPRPPSFAFRQRSLCLFEGPPVSAVSAVCRGHQFLSGCRLHQSRLSAPHLADSTSDLPPKPFTLRVVAASTLLFPPLLLGGQKHEHTHSSLRHQGIPAPAPATLVCSTSFV